MLEKRLLGRSWIMGDEYSIADIATFPWIRNLIGFYESGDLVGITDFPNVLRGKLVLGVEADLVRLIRQAHLFEHDRYLDAIGGRQRVQLQTLGMLGWPFGNNRKRCNG